MGHDVLLKQLLFLHIVPPNHVSAGLVKEILRRPQSFPIRRDLWGRGVDNNIDVLYSLFGPVGVNWGRR